MPVQCFVALDIATKTGWCVYDRGAWTSGVWNMSRSTSKKKAEGEYARLVKLRENLTFLATQHPAIEFVGFEKVNFARYALAHGVWNQLLAVTQLWRIDTGLAEDQVMSIGTSSLKKFATGSGRAEKVDMIAAAEKLWPGLRCKDDNEADARLISAWMASRLGVSV